VVSDWFGTRSTVGAARAGLDLEMPGPAVHFGEALVKAVVAGDVDLTTIDSKLVHLRLLADRTGATSTPPAPDRPGGTDDALEAARAAAVGATVLLRNELVDDACALPLDAAAINRLAVIGPNADREVVGGGGSARLTPTSVTTVLDGLRAVMGGDRVSYELGCLADRGTPGIDGRRVRRADGTAGIDVEIIDGAGDVRVRLRPRELRLLVASEPWPGAASSGWSLRASCSYEPARSGTHHIKLKTNCVARVAIDGATVIDTASGSADCDVELLEGTSVSIAIAGAPPADDQLFRVALELRCSPPALDDGIDRAAATARVADAAVVVVGLDGEWETEGRDRDDLALPGAQVELIRAVAAAQPRTAVVVLAGAPVDLSWAEEVPALVWAWYPGQEGGHAIADVLLGRADPGGRLPCTLPARLEDTLAVPSAERGTGHVRYGEGVLTGHRRYDREGIDPAFPFGFGLSYSTFAIGGPVVSTATVAPGASLTVQVEVTNTGSRAGSEVLQLYVTDVEASVPRPDRELRAFAKVHLDPGERRTVDLRVGPRDLAFWDTSAVCWRAEAGMFELHVGRSSRDLIGSAAVELLADWVVPASWWSDS
jgi:beta-glucosidase